MSDRRLHAWISCTHTHHSNIHTESQGENIVPHSVAEVGHKNTTYHSYAQTTSIEIVTPIHFGLRQDFIFFLIEAGVENKYI